MSLPHPLKHINHFGEANLDTVTLRLLREGAAKANADDERIRESLSAEHARVEWDPVFARDSVERYQAIERIDAELAKRSSAPVLSDLALSDEDRAALNGPATMHSIIYDSDFLEVEGTPEEAAQLLAWFNLRKDLEASWGEVEGDRSDCQWRIHQRHGGVNDQEWKEICYAEHLIDALRAAHKAFCDGR